MAAQPLIDELQNRGVLLACIQEAPFWTSQQSSGKFTCLSNLETECAIIYHEVLQSIYKRSIITKRWMGVQFAEFMVVRAHMPCGVGRQRESSENNEYRSMLIDIQQTINQWKLGDNSQNMLGIRQSFVGADANTHLIADIDGFTGSNVLVNGIWDDRVQPLFDFMGQNNLRATNTYAGEDDGEDIYVYIYIYIYILGSTLGAAAHRLILCSAVHRSRVLRRPSGLTLRIDQTTL